MKQALFRRVFGKSIFQGLDVENVVVLGTDQNLWLEHAPLAIFHQPGSRSMAT
jgi:hypothetical protein